MLLSGNGATSELTARSLKFGAPLAEIPDSAARCQVRAVVAKGSRSKRGGGRQFGRLAQEGEILPPRLVAVSRGKDARRRLLRQGMCHPGCTRQRHRQSRYSQLADHFMRTGAPHGGVSVHVTTS